MQALQNQLDSVRTLLEQHSEHSTDNVSLVSPSGDGKKIPSNLVCFFFSSTTCSICLLIISAVEEWYSILGLC